ncbi:hypothetical protein NW762_012042 [Fusarium torreyae]|uniref:Uncharacterized protein n=1 Tax=Fusarium torreyae TaxID=1237075 RepID=A0A9W8VBT5_9HYPO|nr:hypothetical protein NW762_012042 [Fusarium torreyae]
MRCHASPLLWAGIVWLFLSLIQVVDCQITVKTGDYSHVRERIWLWDRYTVIAEILGADKQKILLVQNPGHNWPTKRHVGSGPNGQLTYPEFMADLEQKFTGQDFVPDPTLKAPGSEGPGSPSILEGLQQAWLMQVKFITPDEKTVKDHETFLSLVDKKYHELQVQFGDDPRYEKLFDETNDRAKKLVEEINAIRKQETEEHTKVQITTAVDAKGTKENKKKYGLGLDEADLVIEQVQTMVPGQTWAYDKVNIAETITKKSQEQRLFREIKQGRHRKVAGLASWACNLGNANLAKNGPISPDNIGHNTSSEAWKGVESRAVAGLGGSGSFS